VSTAIGFLETNSIARGVQAADEMLKAAEVTLVFARPNCPGKYNVLIKGEVAAVDAAIQAGIAAAGSYLVEQLVIARVHPEVVRAISAAGGVSQVGALGVLEYFSITGAILGADAAVKAAQVELVDVRLGTGIGGKSFAVITGDVAAVTQAVEHGAAIAKKDGMLFAKTVIARPTPAIFESML